MAALAMLPIRDESRQAEPVRGEREPSASCAACLAGSGTGERHSIATHVRSSESTQALFGYRGHSRRLARRSRFGQRGGVSSIGRLTVTARRVAPAHCRRWSSFCSRSFARRRGCFGVAALLVQQNAWRPRSTHGSARSASFSLFCVLEQAVLFRVASRADAGVALLGGLTLSLQIFVELFEGAGEVRLPTRSARKNVGSRQQAPV